MAVDFAPVRHRRETLREQNLRMELTVARQEALAHCTRLEIPLNRLYGMAMTVSPAFEQMAAAALHEVARYRRRNER